MVLSKNGEFNYLAITFNISFVMSERWHLLDEEPITNNSNFVVRIPFLGGVMFCFSLSCHPLNL